jgi:hypothetical protein
MGAVLDRVEFGMEALHHRQGPRASSTQPQTMDYADQLTVQRAVYPQHQRPPTQTIQAAQPPAYCLWIPFLVSDLSARHSRANEGVWGGERVL